MQRQATRKTERTLTKKGTGKSHWDAQQQEAFGNVLHKRFPLGSAVPPDVDPELLRPGVDNSFLNDDIKELLGIPVNRKPHMALGAPRVPHLGLGPPARSSRMGDVAHRRLTRWAACSGQSRALGVPEASGGLGGAP